MVVKSPKLDATWLQHAYMSMTVKQFAPELLNFSIMANYGVEPSYSTGPQLQHVCNYKEDVRDS